MEAQAFFVIFPVPMIYTLLGIDNITYGYNHRIQKFEGEHQKDKLKE